MSSPLCPSVTDHAEGAEGVDHAEGAEGVDHAERAEDAEDAKIHSPSG
jgi:hypothetical protein